MANIAKEETAARVGAVVTTIVPIPVRTLVTRCAILQASRFDYRNLMKAEIKEQDTGWQNGMAKSITFIVTKDCQLACKYCYLVGKNTKERMTWDVAKKAVDFILDHENDFTENSVIWEFIGGEPFLEIELIDKI